MSALLKVLDGGVEHDFAFADLMRYHGPGSPGGVAHAFKAMERAFPELAPGARPERRAITIATAFGGPGARDGFELVTRAVTGERFRVEPSLARPELGVTRERFVFHFEHGDQRAVVALREGFVSEEFLALAHAERRDDADEARLDALKRDMADRVMARAAAEVYDLV